MSENNKRVFTKEDLAIKWFGVDGAMILLYVVLSSFYGYGFINRVDWICIWAAPIITSAIALGIFANYLQEVFKFAGKAKADAEERRAKENK